MPFSDEQPAGAAAPVPGQGRRVALVIGNGGYRKPGAMLSNPPRDAEAIAGALARLGFEFVAQPGVDAPWHKDVDNNGFGWLLGRFAVEARTADMAVMYFAGHGIEVHGANYLVPVSADLEDAGAVQFETRSLPDVLAALQGARKLRLMILDACRNDPFRHTMRGMEGQRSVGVSLRQPEPPGNTLVFYAARHGTTAKDGKPGGNSPFATALLRHIETPDLEILHMFGEVADDVRELTGHAQEPYIYGTKGRELIYLKRSVREQPVLNLGSSGQAVNATIQSDAAKAWPEVRDSRNPARLALFEQHFAGTWPAVEARSLREEIEAEQAAAARQQAAAAERAKAAAKAEAARQREASNWAWATEQNTIEAFERFLAAWPAGRYSDEARARIAALQAVELERRGKFRALVGLAGQQRKVWLAPGETAPKDAPFAPELVLVPPGKFWMGSKDGEGYYDEHPRHEVTIGYPLLVGKYPVTFEEWDACVADGGTKHKPGDAGWGRERRPVINVSWNDITTDYLPWLNRKLGLSGAGAYRLLTEAEWEYCCRAREETAYSFGDTITTAQAQFSEDYAGSARQTVEVGQFPSNAFGLYDMHGNVWEWCEDACADDYQGAPDDGSARSSANITVSRVLRGGSWFSQPVDLRSAVRNDNEPDYRNFNLGFRLARTLLPSP